MDICFLHWSTWVQFLIFTHYSWIPADTILEGRSDGSSGWDLASHVGDLGPFTHGLSLSIDSEMNQQIQTLFQIYFIFKAALHEDTCKSNHEKKLYVKHKYLNFLANQQDFEMKNT